jgi:hypothetical protein
MSSHRIRPITKRLVEVQAVTSDDLRSLMTSIDNDDCFTREEVEDIIAIDRVVDGRCVGWQEFVTRTVVAHVVWERRPTGYVRGEDAAWLMVQLGGEAAPAGSRARALARAVVSEAEGADESLIAFAMGAEPVQAMRFAARDASADLRWSA